MGDKKLNRTPTTTWNSPGWHVVESYCAWCGATIREAKPVYGHWDRGKRNACHNCLARWWAYHNKSKEQAR